MKRMLDHVIVYVVWTVVAVLSVAAKNARAEAPPVPSTQPLGVKETLVAWNQSAADWTTDQAMQMYFFDDAASKRFASELADALLPQEQLQKLVRDKWGADAETKVCRECSSDTIADDQAATVSVHGGHTIVRFKDDVCAPVPMCRVNGEWKLDLKTLIPMLGQTFPAAEKNVIATTPILKKALADLKAGKFATADELAKSLEKQLGDATTTLDFGQQK